MSDVPDELDRLNELLGAIPLECEGMTIGDLDGYVAGLIVCPEPVLPAEWLPTVWGGENGFAEFDGADEIAAAVLDHYNRVARELAEEPESYAHVMEVDRTDGDLLWGRGSTASNAQCGCAPMPRTPSRSATTRRPRRRSARSWP